MPKELKMPKGYSRAKPITFYDFYKIELFTLFDETAIVSVFTHKGKKCLCDWCKKERTVSNFYDVKCSPEEHEYLEKTGYVCGKCMIKDEKKFIRSIKTRELPLWINHRWLHKASSRFYKDRIQEAKV